MLSYKIGLFNKNDPSYLYLLLFDFLPFFGLIQAHTSSYEAHEKSLGLLMLLGLLVKLSVKKGTVKNTYFFHNPTNLSCDKTT